VRELIAVALGGMLGSVSRYAVQGWIQDRTGTFPWGTMAVNVTGSFLIGVLATLFFERMHVSQATRAFMLIGVLGGYTTFSTLSYESFRLIEDGAWPMALANSLGSLLVGLVALWLGVMLARALPS
jgi:CrcB protein